MTDKLTSEQDDAAISEMTKHMSFEARERFFAKREVATLKERITALEAENARKDAVILGIIAALAPLKTALTANHPTSQTPTEE